MAERATKPPDRSSRGFATRAIKAATTPPIVNQRPNSVPLYLSATFSADDAEELGAIATGTRPGYAYARIDNPTGAALADAIAEIEGSEAARAFASGMGAIHAALASVLRAARSFKSAPVQNARSPAPVMTMTRTSSRRSS